MPQDLAPLDGLPQAELERKGEVTPLELVDAAIARVEQLNTQLNAMNIPLFDKASAQAQRVGSGVSRSDMGLKGWREGGVPKRCLPGAAASGDCGAA